MTDEAGAQKSREQLIVDKDFLYAENRRLRAKLAEADDRVVSFMYQKLNGFRTSVTPPKPRTLCGGWSGRRR